MENKGMAQKEDGDNQTWDNYEPQEEAGQQGPQNDG